MYDGRAQLLGNLRQSLLLISFIAVAMVSGSAGERREEANEAARQTVLRLLLDYGSRLEPAPGRERAGCYVRYSTEQQDSFESQLRAIFDYAAENGFSLTQETIFFDLGVTGKKANRVGIEACRASRRRGDFESFLLFSSSRFARSQRMMLEILDEEFAKNGTRCILIDKRLDSADKEAWKIVGLYAWFDEFQRTAQSDNIRAAHRALLAQGLIYSSVPYGVRGEEIEGILTRRGLPLRRMVIHEEQKEVVEMIFRFRVEQNMNIGAIVCQLNSMPALPMPIKSTSGRFTRTVVSRILKSPVSVGIFVYNNSVDVSDMTPSEMRVLAETDPNVFCFEHLRLIPDDLFIRARVAGKLDSDKVRKRKPRSGKSMPFLLNGLLKCCGCGRRLAASGNHGKYYVCLGCKDLPIDQRYLFSQLPRELATELILKAICDEVMANEEVVEQCVAEVSRQVEEFVAPNLRVLESLERERRSVANSLVDIHKTFSGDELLIREQLEHIKLTLRRLDSETAVERSKVEKTVAPPAPAEIRTRICEVAENLLNVFEAQQPDDYHMARKVLNDLTHNQIMVEQMGERVKNKGWTRVLFSVDLSVLINGYGGPNVRIKKEIDILPKRVLDPNIAKARGLYDNDLFETEIAEKLGCSRTHVNQLLNKSFEATGELKPDGYERRKRIESDRQSHLYQRKSDEVFQLTEQGLLLCEIADKLEIDRNVVTKSYAFAREKRGLPTLKGQSRRKLLTRKTRS